MDKLNEINQKLNDLKLSEEQKAYALAKAWYETLHNAEEEIEAKVLQENEFLSVCPEIPELDGKRAERAYEFVKNEEEFKRYQKLFYAECDRQGISWEWGKTIDGDAFYALKEAENILLDWFEKSIEKFEQIKSLKKAKKESIELMRKHWKYREQLIDMAMKWKSDWEKYAA